MFKVGIIGCGRISRNHCEAIKSVDGFQLTAVCDLIPERAASTANAYGAQAFDSADRLLSDGDVDVVVLATPSGLHPLHGVMAAEAGKHVISEKPMAITLESADKLVQACDAAGVHLFVVKQNRLNPSVQLLKRAVDSGRFGQIYVANTTVRWTRPQEYYDMADWRGTWELDGGAFMNQASHYVDLVQWLVGSVESVSAKTATLARNIEAEDTGAAVLRFRNGAIGVIEVTMLTFPKNLEGSITLLGERGSAQIGGRSLNRIEHWEFADYHDDDRLVDMAGTDPPSVYGFGHLPYYENVLSVLKGEARPGTDGREGRKSLALICGIYESARTGREFSFPLDS